LQSKCVGYVSHEAVRRRGRRAPDPHRVGVAGDPIAPGRPIPSTSLSRSSDDRNSTRTIVFRSARSCANRRSCGAPRRVRGRAAPPERSGGQDLCARRAPLPRSDVRHARWGPLANTWRPSRNVEKGREAGVQLPLRKGRCPPTAGVERMCPFGRSSNIARLMSGAADPCHLLYPRSLNSLDLLCLSSSLSTARGEAPSITPMTERESSTFATMTRTGLLVAQ